MASDLRLKPEAHRAEDQEPSTKSSYNLYQLIVVLLNLNSGLHVIIACHG